jgi:hypothetical protein
LFSVNMYESAFNKEQHAGRWHKETQQKTRVLCYGGILSLDRVPSNG